MSENARSVWNQPICTCRTGHGGCALHPISKTSSRCIRINGDTTIEQLMEAGVTEQAARELIEFRDQLKEKGRSRHA